MPRRYSRKTKKGKQSGGAAAMPSGVAYTPADVDEFFQEILKKPTYGNYLVGTDLSAKYFENVPGKREIQLKAQWNKMINECFNRGGHTPLYYALRFDAHHMLIGILLKSITDVNRRNNTNPEKGRITDGSTPLIGLCYGSKMDAIVKFNKIVDLIRELTTKGGDLSLTNNSGESALKWLDYKAMNKLINFVDYD